MKTGTRRRRRPPPRPKTQPRNTTPLDPAAITEIVAGMVSWTGGRRITWTDVIDIAERTTGIRYSRQALFGKPEIKRCYEAKVKLQRRRAASPPKPRKRGPLEVQTTEKLREQIVLRDAMVSDRDATIADQKKRIDNLMEMFARWELAILSNGPITLEMLQTPLPRANRS